VNEERRKWEGVGGWGVGEGREEGSVGRNKLSCRGGWKERVGEEGSVRRGGSGD